MRVQMNDIRDFDNRCKTLLLQEGYRYEAVYPKKNFDDDGWAPTQLTLTNTKTCESNIFPANGWRTMIAFFCPHCAAELYGDWIYHKVVFRSGLSSEFHLINGHQKAVIESLEADVKNVQNTTKCPVCGHLLSQGEGFYLEDTGRSHYGLLDRSNLANNPTKSGGNPIFPPTAFEEYCSKRTHITKEDYISDIFDFMQTQRDAAEKSWAEAVVDTVEEDNSVFVGQFPNKDKIQEIKSSAGALHEYLDKLIKMELNIYSLKKYLSELYCIQKATIRNVKGEQVQPFYKLFQEKQAEYLKHLALVETHKNTPVKLTAPLPVQPAKPILKEAGLFNKKKVMAENEALQQKYQADMAEYQAKVQAYEQKKAQLILVREQKIAEETAELEKEKNELHSLTTQLQNGSQDLNFSSPACLSKAMVDKEVSDAEDLLKKLCACRAELYEYNIVFGKYRNVVALSTFCEYLMAGRCATLEGADGAYNLYEDQIRADMIIGQLSQVIAKLDEIKDTQYMIYSELQKVNKNLEQLNSTMDRALISIQNMEQNVEHISANTDVIAHNTAVTAYYSKLNAELTNSLGYMVAFQ